jgi:hypothetical protein
MFPWFHRSTQARRAWAAELARNGPAATEPAAAQPRTAASDAATRRRTIAQDDGSGAPKAPHRRRALAQEAPLVLVQTVGRGPADVPAARALVVAVVALLSAAEALDGLGHVREIGDGASGCEPSSG